MKDNATSLNEPNRVVNRISAETAVELIHKKYWTRKHVIYFTKSGTMVDLTKLCPHPYANPELKECIEADLDLLSFCMKPLENTGIEGMTWGVHRSKMWYSEESTGLVYEVDIHDESNCE